MADEPEARTEGEETEASEFMEEVTTDATDTEVGDVSGDATDTEVGDVSGYETTEGVLAPSASKDGRGKAGSWMERCVDRRWISAGEPLWRIYMKSYAELRLGPDGGDGRKVSAADVARLPRAEATDGTSPTLYECFPLGGFQLERTAGTSAVLDRCKRTRIWTSMRRQPTKAFRRRGGLSRTGSGKWPGVWPCVSRDAASELKGRGREGRRKRRDVFPCDPVADDEDETLLREQTSDFANRKELGHVRAPVACLESKRKLLVDRAAGERPGLVDGDYVIVELSSFDGRDKRTYANVVLRGLKGMRLPELGPLRERRDTWKFCFYQAIVALLAKTQLRYKYAWSANIDYIYDHAWTLYAHIGAINVKGSQRLDDVVVYNYKYSVEIELIREMRDVPVARNVDFGYAEGGLRRQITLRRKDPLNVRVEIGCEKMTDPGYVPVHEDVRGLEEWLDKLPARYRNCILRTSRFSLAFWQDGLFWYVYNPYRCDEFGFWDDGGRACIVKFCSKDSLRRHLMILLLRAYAYEAPRAEKLERSGTGTVFVAQIFHVTYHRCQLQNFKLLQRRAPRSPPRCVDECPSDDALEDREEEEEEEEDEEEEEEDDDPKEPRERPTWLKRYRVTWGRCATTDRKGRGGSVKVAVVNGGGKAKWHRYYVEEPNGLFSLWGEIHINDGMFEEANRGMQTYACYVVCAGMTAITAPEYWSPRILDAIVMCGDRYYARSKREAELKSARSEYAHVRCWDRYLADRFKIGETVFEARMLPAVCCGCLYASADDECLWRSLVRVFSRHRFAILTCESSCLGLFKFCGAYYMCDVNSFGPPIFRHGHGVAYLMRATSFRKFLTTLVLTVGSPVRSRFDLNPVEILRIVQVDRARIGERRDRRWRPRAGPKGGVKNAV